MQSFVISQVLKKLTLKIFASVLVAFMKERISEVFAILADESNTSTY